MVKVVTFYKFRPIEADRLESLKVDLTKKAEQLNIKGLLLIGVEGCNATISGEEESLEVFKRQLKELPEIGELTFKESKAENHPFRRFKVDIREEIVTLKDTAAVPRSITNNHLPPREWQRVLESEPDVVLIDTRNSYETEIGIFEGAIDLNLKKFSDFPEKVKELQIPREKKVLMYCTGGIRCEKAILDMQKQGYENVFQLEGGILKYLEEYPHQKFSGECFVFDHRVSVDQSLQPSKRYKLCPHCGNPADVSVECVLCQKPAVVCKHCLSDDKDLRACSKNCAYHARVRKLIPSGISSPSAA